MSTEFPRSVDVLAIGCGPFNLGLAALASTVDDLDLLVVDARPEFRWHPGLMFDDATLQVSFLSDLVSLVEPTHPLSFLAYLADVDRLYPFLVRENFFPTRIEYEAYLLWVVERLGSLRWDTSVSEVHFDPETDSFRVIVTSGGQRTTIHAAHVVCGVGTEPHLPPSLSTGEARSPSLIHSGEYLNHRARAHAAEAVTVIGSGQSGAEIVVDLLEANLGGGPAVRWWTRTGWFAPLDFTKLSLEMTTPAYMDYFHSLPEQTRDTVRAGHWQFHKGISADTLERLHDLLYRRQLAGKLPAVQLRVGVSVTGLEAQPDERLRIHARHDDTGATIAHTADLVVAATGYRPRSTAFLDPLDGLMERDSRGRPVIDNDHSVVMRERLERRLFVANAEEHSHGVSSPNLDIGAVRNARILNAVTGREVYRLPGHTAFTTFGPDDDEVVDAAPQVGT
ncbi:lysine N(6)-hydroxylase/L-ornithine N(5)-oxygenase family protein [Williamsia herbipolensis]|uniref:lysine N(6)-hydroxylase/L-ornithine N(5)-oxygenase family protein n=1 Tax=Williamsia herbipolensis TaxID=1603258 RepID=UPI0005F81672|nr:SidA/IucD/PvdA family monooxygenase [Williamsia herbipolensis]